ncbi:MAG TPA: BrnA antitoxin family protein [Bordetella sp.]
MRKVDAHIIAEHEYDELPELTDEMMTRAVVNKGGRPRSASPKVLLSVRYSQEVVDFFRATGDGWQSRMDGVLRNYVKRHRKPA